MLEINFCHHRCSLEVLRDSKFSPCFYFYIGNLDMPLIESKCLECTCRQMQFLKMLKWTQAFLLSSFNVSFTKTLTFHAPPPSFSPPPFLKAWHSRCYITCFDPLLAFLPLERMALPPQIVGNSCCFGWHGALRSSGYMWMEHLFRLVQHSWALYSLVTGLHIALNLFLHTFVSFSSNLIYECSKGIIIERQIMYLTTTLALAFWVLVVSLLASTLCTMVPAPVATKNNKRSEWINFVNGWNGM